MEIYVAMGMFCRCVSGCIDVGNCYFLICFCDILIDHRYAKERKV